VFVEGASGEGMDEVLEAGVKAFEEVDLAQEAEASSRLNERKEKKKKKKNGDESDDEEEDGDLKSKMHKGTPEVRSVALASFFCRSLGF
jgi:ribosomal protein L12E/L44/L45/RPP1/RPP2